MRKNRTGLHRVLTSAVSYPTFGMNWNYEPFLFTQHQYPTSPILWLSGSKPLQPDSKILRKTFLEWMLLAHKCSRVLEWHVLQSHKSVMSGCKNEKGSTQECASVTEIIVFVCVFHSLLSLIMSQLIETIVDFTSFSFFEQIMTSCSYQESSLNRRVSQLFCCCHACWEFLSIGWHRAPTCCVEEIFLVS